MRQRVAINPHSGAKSDSRDQEDNQDATHDETNDSELAPRLQNLHGTMRQRLQKGTAIGLGHDPVVKHDHDSMIALSADEPANTLAKLQNRFRKRIFGE